MNGNDQKVEEPRVVAPDQIASQLDQLRQGPPARLLFFRREEEREVFGHGDVVPKGLMVIAIQEVILQAAEEERRHHAHHRDVSRPQ